MKRRKVPKDKKTKIESSVKKMLKESGVPEEDQEIREIDALIEVI